MFCRKKIIAVLIVGLASLIPAWAQDYAVIVNPGNTTTLDKSAVSKIFLAKMKSFPGGGRAVPIMQKSDSDITKKFIKEILRKLPSQYRGYWSKIIFTGKGNLPKEYGDDAVIKELVGKNPNLIGYITAEAVDDSVRVVLKF